MNSRAFCLSFAPSALAMVALLPHNMETLTHERP